MKHHISTYILQLLGVALLLLATISCTKYNLIDGPKPIRHDDKTMWEYFNTDPYNWSMTQELIEHAGLRNIFEGKSELGTDFTFFGITNHSIRASLLNKKEIEGLDEMPKITELPAEECRTIILNLIYPKRKMLDEWAEGRTVKDQVIGTGGEMATMHSGLVLWIYVFRLHYNGVPEKGPKKINLVHEANQKRVTVASHNINTKTGVVHSLEYNARLFDFQ